MPSSKPAHPGKHSQNRRAIGHGQADHPAVGLTLFGKSLFHLLPQRGEPTVGMLAQFGKTAVGMLAQLGQAAVSMCAQLGQAAARVLAERIDALTQPHELIINPFKLFAMLIHNHFTSGLPFDRQARPKKVHSRLLGGLAAALLALPALAATIVRPDDARLQYTGRVDFANPQAPVLSWPGTSIEGNFTGDSLALKLKDQFGKNYFNVFIDGDLAHPKIVKADEGSRTYAVASGLPAGQHRFLITKRTEGEEGATVFQGLELSDKGKLLAPPPRKQRHIEFFGDSITSGMGNEAPDNGPDHLLNEKNNFLSYASITARNLDAEAHITSQSGIGVMVSWFPFTMPDFYDQVNAVGNNDSKWDFSSWTPDVVVINLMQNDKWLIDREKRLQPVPDDAQRVQAYKTFVQKIRAVYPRAYIVCALGSMDASSAGSKWPGYVRTAVEQIQREQDDKRIDTVFFDFTGFQGHPRVKQHEANAARLTAFIKARLGW